MWSGVDREQAAVDLAEARGGALVVPLAHHGGVERGVRRLPRRAGPRALFGHRGVQFLGLHRPNNDTLRGQGRSFSFVPSGSPRYDRCLRSDKWEVPGKIVAPTYVEAKEEV